MMRVGCRPLKRRLLACGQARRKSDYTVGCDDLKVEMDKCIRLLQYLQSPYAEYDINTGFSNK
jgi:hypothetical protein